VTGTAEQTALIQSLHKQLSLELAAEHIFPESIALSPSHQMLAWDAQWGQGTLPVTCVCSVLSLDEDKGLALISVIVSVDLALPDLSADAAWLALCSRLAVLLSPVLIDQEAGTRHLVLRQDMALAMPWRGSVVLSINYLAWLLARLDGVLRFVGTGRLSTEDAQSFADAIAADIAQEAA